MATARARNRRLFDGAFGTVYSFYIEREWLSRLISHAVWGSDLRHYYASMAAISELPDGATLVDCPCGTGVALRALSSAQRVRYVGFDLSPAMLERARRRARHLGLSEAVLRDGDAQALPLDTGSADLFVSYFGLHCFDDPPAAVREAARCLRPGGALVGSAIVRGTRPLDRFRVRPGVGGFGRVGDPADLLEWLALAGLERIAVETRGVFAVFSAARPGGPPGATGPAASPGSPS